MSGFPHCDKTTLLDLPEELLLRIFCFLPKWHLHCAPIYVGAASVDDQLMLDNIFTFSEIPWNPSLEPRRPHVSVALVCRAFYRLIRPIQNTKLFTGVAFMGRQCNFGGTVSQDLSILTAKDPILPKIRHLALFWNDWHDIVGTAFYEQLFNLQSVDFFGSKLDKVFSKDSSCGCRSVRKSEVTELYESLPTTYSASSNEVFRPGGQLPLCQQCLTKWDKKATSIPHGFIAFDDPPIEDPLRYMTEVLDELAPHRHPISYIDKKLIKVQFADFYVQCVSHTFPISPALDTTRTDEFISA